MLARLNSGDHGTSRSPRFDLRAPTDLFACNGGQIELSVGPHERRVRRPDFLAAWSHGDEQLDGPAVPSTASLRTGALIIATGQGLLVSRGPYGGKPLYYRQQGDGGVVVSSTLSAVVAEAGGSLPLDVEKLGCLALASAGNDPRSTVYHGVRRVLPCETILFAIRHSRSSIHLPPIPTQSSGEVREHAAALRDLLTLVVDEQVRRFHSLAVATGGGLDSGGLLALAVRASRAQASGGRCTGLTMHYASDGDDRPHLEVLLAALGAETIRVTPAELTPLSLDSFVQDAAPVTWPTTPMERLAGDRARAWGAEAIISGCGGDQVLDGDDRSFVERVRRGDCGAIRDAARLRVPWSSSGPSRVTGLVLRPLLRPFIPGWVLARRRREHVASRDATAWAGPRLRPLMRPTIEPPIGSESWTSWFACSPLMADAMDAAGQEECHSGLPQIDPYLDPRLVDLLASFPAEHLFAGDRQRGLYRLAMEGILPDSLRFRCDKASFEPLVAETLRAAGGTEGAVPQLLTMEASADLGLVEPAAFRSAFTRVASNGSTQRGWLGVWPMLAVEAFLRTRSSGPASRAA